MFEYDRGQWLLWDERRWVPDSVEGAVKMARGAVRNIYDAAKECVNVDQYRTLARHALESEAEHRLRAALKLCRSNLYVRAGLLDANPWLLNVLNGTIDLRTGEVRKHRRDDLITRLVPVTYDSGATAPSWERFLLEVFEGCKDLVSYVRRAIGYSLTASTKEQLFFFIHGSGANAKTTFLRVVSALLADYALCAAAETFLERRGDRGIPNDIARLAGARLVIADEVPEGKRLAESLVKRLTGGDNVAARFLHREFFEFVPSFKLWIAANHRPRIRGTDHAIWRRIREIPFDARFEGDRRDPDIADKLLEELPGILTWALKGCLEWQLSGLGETVEVAAASDRYRGEMDVLQPFFDESCELSSAYAARKGQLYEAYVRWAESSGERPIGKRDFGARLRERGFDEDRGTGGVEMWVGIRLRSGASD